MVKPFNYSQVMAVQQGSLEMPVAFLQRHKNALQKHTNIVPESQKKEIILKDKFLTQSAPDIHKKLQKLVSEGIGELDQLVCVVTSIYYNRDLEKEKKKNLEKEKRKDKWQEALIAALREVSLGQSPNLRTCFQCGQQAILGGRAPKKATCRTLPICWGKHWKAHCPWFPGELRPEPPTQ
jgi:hypothetical protein